MNLKLNRDEKIRVSTTDTDINAPFLNVKAEENDSETHYNKFVSATFHDVHSVFIIRKERSIKTFVFRTGEVVIKSDFGWWSDGEILFTNSKIID